jgi:uncharacterized protein
MLDHKNITHIHWQMKIGRNRDQNSSTLGEIVTDIADIEQCINTIILTEKGSVPTQPLKCISLSPYVDRRSDYAIPYITREIFDALSLWEPRIVVTDVNVHQESFDHWRYVVFWRLSNDAQQTIYQTDVQPERGQLNVE